jgi:hypothetical protein
VARIASAPARRARCGGHRGPTPPQAHPGPANEPRPSNHLTDRSLLWLRKLTGALSFRNPQQITVYASDNRSIITWQRRPAFVTLVLEVHCGRDAFHNPIWGANCAFLLMTKEVAVPLAHSFGPDQMEAMNSALKRAFAKLPEPTPVTEIIAIRILELACAGECDPNKLTETVSAEFDL